jgi:putative PEP-CTERM system histidine kinase
MNLPALICLLAAVWALLLVIGAAALRPRTLPQWTFLAGMLLLSLEQFCHFASLDALAVEGLLAWGRVAGAVSAPLAAVWLLFCLTFARGNAAMFLRKWRLAVLGLGVVPLALALGFWPHLLTEALWTTRLGNWVFQIGPAGKALHAVLVVGLVLALMNLEWTFRAAVGTARWKIKYAVFGLAALFGTRIYTSSQVILYSASDVQLLVLNASALVLAGVLFTVSFLRSQLGSLDIYPSSTVLHKSLSVLLVAAYLMSIGVLAKVVTALGGAEAFPLQAMLILVALVGLGVLCFSDRVRAALKRFVSRHLQRPAHDYRQVWTTFTQRTLALLDREAFARAAAALLSETFEVLSVTVWLADARSGKLVCAASTSLETNAAAAPPLPDLILGELPVAPAATPVNIDRSDARWCALLRQSNPAVFPKGGNRMCVPLVSGGAVGGLIVLGDRVNGLPFSTEDLELLKCLGDQIAAALWKLSLSDKLVQARELEAFQAMSAFLVHDLKNTASALSLTLRNLPVHFENPAFREDALRTLAKSVGRVNELIGRLTTLRQGLELQKAPADLNAVVNAALASLGPPESLPLRRQSEPLDAFLMDAKLMESVITNLVLNAREALGPEGEIQVATRRQNGWALLTVTDNGCGMSPEFLARSLFKPFRTTKRSGLGIGMFQSKAIVEAHGGRISVQSEPGAGTTFCVWLPLAASP